MTVADRDNAEMVAKVNGKWVSRGELSVAFDAVANKANWKNPIDKIVDLDAYGIALVKEAVIFYTGSVPSFTAFTGTTTSGIGKYRVKAVGYYVAIGA